jgi:flavin reductase (DIM6/NTAB) family NADH-FMN oxidoreductase RutF
VDWVWRFGLSSGRDRDKFAGLASHAGRSGAPILDEAPGWLDCLVEGRLDTGDRTVYLAEVIEAHSADDRPLLTWQRALSLAPAERVEELKRQMADARAIEGQAIAAWRAAGLT